MRWFAACIAIYFLGAIILAAYLIGLILTALASFTF